jgi:tryptophan-rich sensory protein
VLAWWALAVIIRSGYRPLAFGGRRLWAATADAALLFAIMARYAFLAHRVDQTAAVLALPEIDWTASATVLARRSPRKTANWPKRFRAAVPRERGFERRLA